MKERANCMSYLAATIANEFLRLGERDGIPIGPMKLQKLVYLAHGWHLAFLGTPLIHESIEAWKYGPVVPSLYRQFREFRSDPITRLADGPEMPLIVEDRKLIEAVWDKYKNNTPLQLSMYTHEAGYAWDLARRGHEQDWNSPHIPDYLILDEFRRRASLQKHV